MAIWFTTSYLVVANLHQVNGYMNSRYSFFSEYRSNAGKYILAGLLICIIEYHVMFTKSRSFQFQNITKNRLIRLVIPKGFCGIGAAHFKQAKQQQKSDGTIFYKSL